MRTYEKILAAMQLRYRELSGFDADSASDIGIRLKVLARQVFELAGEMEELGLQVFPQTSSGRYLDLHAETRGIARKGAVPAQGTLRFARETPAPADIHIPAGVLCSTRPDPQVQFETAEAAVLPAGESAVEIAARAVDHGAQGNVAAGAVCLMVTPASGISAVSNPAPFSGGVDGEDDASLRERLLQNYANISNGTNRAFYYDLAMQWEGVTSVNIRPRARGRGTVDVVVQCAPAAERELIAAMQEDLDHRKEINVDVLVRAAKPLPVAIAVEIAFDDGGDPVLMESLCREAVSGCVARLGVGGELMLSRLGAALLQVEGLYNYRILSPAADTRPQSDEVITLSGLSVSRMAVS